MRALGLLAITLVAVDVVAQTPKPEWPAEFDAPFLLYDLPPATPIVGEVSHFYYNFDQYEAQTVRRWLLSFFVLV